MHIPASGLREPPRTTKCLPMESPEERRKIMGRPWVEWGLFALGVLLIIAGIIISPLPGPGGVFLIAPGAALILRTSMWAKRRYVRIKRWQPKAGRWMDWALRRSSAQRRQAAAKSRRQRAELPHGSPGD
jgi:hypothetical protein